MFLLKERSVLFRELIFIFGGLILFCGMFFFTRWNAYHTSVYIFFIFPILVIVKDADLWRDIIRSKIFIILFLFLIFASLSILWSGEDVSELRYNFLILFFVISIYLYARSHSNLMSKCLSLSVFLSAVSCVYAMLEFYFLQGMLGARFVSNMALLDHTILSSFVYGFFFLVGVFFLHKEQSFKIKMVYFVSVLVLFLFLVVAQSRGVMLAVSLALAYYIFSIKWRYRWYFFSFIGVVGVVFFAFNQEYFLNRGWSYRHLLWYSGISMGEENLWFGRGIWSEYVVRLETGKYWDHPHNIVIKIFIDLGLVGVFLWALLWGCSCYKLYCSGSAFRFLGVSLVIFSIVSTVFDGDGPFVKIREVWFVSWIPLALVMAWSFEKKLVSSS